MPAYDAIRFTPPAPLAHVSLRDPKTGCIFADVALLLDSGADVTLLPRISAEGTGVAPIASQRYELIGFDGSRSFAPAVFLDMFFLSRAFRGRSLLIEGDTGVLGRDVLNHVILRLDGPGKQWSEQSTEPNL
jgi:hypothetical protein